MALSPATSQGAVYPRGCAPFVAVHAVEVTPGSLARGTLLAASNHTVLGCRQLGTSPGLEEDIQGRSGWPLLLPASLPATSVPWQPPVLASLHGRPPYLVNRHGTTLATASNGTGVVATAVLAVGGRPVFASRLAVDTPVQAAVAPVAPARLLSPVALVRTPTDCGPSSPTMMRDGAPRADRGTSSPQAACHSSSVSRSAARSVSRSRPRRSRSTAESRAASRARSARQAARGSRRGRPRVPGSIGGHSWTRRARGSPYTRRGCRPSHSRSRGRRNSPVSNRFSSPSLRHRPRGRSFRRSVASGAHRRHRWHMRSTSVRRGRSHQPMEATSPSPCRVAGSCSSVLPHLGASSRVPPPPPPPL